MPLENESESQVFTKRVEKLVKNEKRRLVFREVVSSVLSPITSVLAPWTGIHGGFLGGYAAVRHGSEYIHDSKMYEEDMDYQRINDKLFQEFAREADATMPEIEREVKDATFLKGCIDKLSQESVRYIRSKTQMTGGWIGMGISLFAMTVPSLLKAATLGLGGTLGSLALVGGISAASLVGSVGLSLTTARRRRKFMNVHNRDVNSRWRKVDRAKYAVLANPALRSNTNSSDQMFGKLDLAIRQKGTALGRSIHTLTSTLKKVFSVSTLINAGVFAACYAAGMDWATLATVFMGTTVLNSSSVRILDAYYRLKETSDGMRDQYQKFRHSRRYDLSYGYERMPDNTNAIQLQNICYCHRYNGADTERIGMRGDIPVIQSDQTIIIKPGINVLGGASGSGKSTLYKLLRHADDLNYGSISYGFYDGSTFKGVRTTDMPRDEIQKSIAFCFQEIENDGQSGIEMLTQANPYMPVEHIEAIASQLDLGLYKDSPNGREPKLYRELSGGEKKRVLFLQAYLSPKTILVFDEPTSGVDEATAGKMLEMLNHDCLNVDGKEQKRTIIYTTHHPEEYRKLNVEQVIDLAPLSDEKKVDDFIRAHGVTRLPSQMTVYPFRTDSEKDDYILLASSRHNKSRGNTSGAITDNVNAFISMSVAARLEREGPPAGQSRQASVKPIDMSIPGHLNSRVKQNNDFSIT